MHTSSVFLPRFFLYGLVILFIALPPGAAGQDQPVARPAGFRGYTDTIAGSKISFDMVAIPGGRFVMGSPDIEKGRRADEGPAHPVRVDSFWIGKLEVSWDEFELFVDPEWEQAGTEEVDAVTRPSPPFTDMSFGMGKDGYPAINMTQYAALAYCKWLTAKTGHFYRLPTEAEWEYACRAGSTTAYHFGDDSSLLHEYAWYDKNSQNKYQKTGTKKPNPWGLYDMHGNVAEWTLDQYVPGQYASFKDTVATSPWAEPAALYPRSVRGGSWEDAPGNVRSAARLGSSPRWKQRDPQIPKSNWWNTDASFVGFRVLRPVKQPSTNDVEKYFASPPKDY